MPTLTWIGKDKVVNHHHDVPYRVLEHKYGFRTEDGDDQTSTNSGNKIIHGDNLEALKSLLPEYESCVKCIYIDPPYNTGNEKWVYNDNVNDPKIKKWLGEVVGSQYEDLCRHDKWLCMMYPRLKLLHKLLAEDGYILISINYAHESAHLRLLCDEIFGSNNFMGEITWESTTQPINSGSAKLKLQQKVEPILFYAKNKKDNDSFVLEELETDLKYPHKGKLGECRFVIIEKSNAGGYERPTMQFDILGQKPREGKRWQLGKDTVDALLANNRIEIVDGIVKMAIYPEDEIDKRKFKPFWSHFPANIADTALIGKNILNDIMGRAVGFDTVNPPKLIEQLLSYMPNNAIILDSFAGSGTTAHAVLNLNKKDGGNRKFILVEMEDYAEDITAERVRRVMRGYGEDKNTTAGTGGAFDYYELGEPMFDEDKNLNEAVSEEKIREYIYYTETKQHLERERTEASKYLLDTYNATGYYFYYERDHLTTLSIDTLHIVTERAEQYVIYADVCTVPLQVLAAQNITFKKIPRDIKRF